MKKNENIRVVFIIPPYFRFKGSYNNRPNTGISNLASILYKNDINVSVYNLDAMNKKNYPTRYSIHKKNLIPDSINLGNGKKELLKKIVSKEPETIIISAGDINVPSTDTGSNYSAILVANNLRKLGYKNRIIGYGPYIEQNKNYDLTIIGDAEHVIKRIIKNSDIKGKIFVDCPEEKLDKIPFLNTDYMKWKVRSKDLDYIWTSRGCRNKCAFCIMPNFFNNRIKHRSSARAVDEIEFRLQKYNTQNFYFTDMDLCACTNKASDICEELIKRNLNITWRCESRIDSINKKQAELMKKAGCAYVKLGIESMNDNRLRFLKKGITVKQIKRKIEILKNTGIGSVVYILLGGPGFSEKDYLKEYEEFKKLDADKYTVSVLNPHKLSKLHKRLNWNNNGYDAADHLNRDILRNKWGISKNIEKLFFNLELTYGREDK